MLFIGARSWQALCEQRERFELTSKIDLWYPNFSFLHLLLVNGATTASKESIEYQTESRPGSRKALHVKAMDNALLASNTSEIEHNTS